MEGSRLTVDEKQINKLCVTLADMTASEERRNITGKVPNYEVTTYARLDRSYRLIEDECAY